uniref:Uncharacterized protein n=1 Tax=Anguilla anguilla TaxID=7936 RepID=A0A0E9V9V0_ANGAN
MQNACKRHQAFNNRVNNNLKNNSENTVL